MVTIRVTPEELRQRADSLEAAANSINSRVETVGDVVEGVIISQILQGNIATGLIQRFHINHPKMTEWAPYLLSFAQLLRVAADVFEQADKENGYAGGGGGGGGGGAWGDDADIDWREFLEDLLESGKISEWMQKGFLRSELALRINQFLLDNYPNLKPEWMRFLRHGGADAVFSIIGDFLTAEPGEYGTTFLGGLAKLGGAYLMDGRFLPSYFQAVDGFVDFANSGDPSDLVSGGLNALIYAHPYGRAIMLANSGIQVLGNGAGWLVETNADWLGNGNPALADGFRRQGQELQDAVGRMDLDNGIDATADAITNLFQGGSASDSWNTFSQGWTDVGGGIADTVLEGSTTFWSVTGSVYGRVFNVDTSDFVATAQDLTWSDVGDTLGDIGEEVEDVVSDGWNYVTSLF